MDEVTKVTNFFGFAAKEFMLVATIMDKFIGTIQHFMFQLSLSHTFWFFLQPPSPHSMLFGGNKLKAVCKTESGPVYAQH